MYFRLDDGKPVWAIAIAQVERETLDEQGQPTTVTETINLYEQSELSDHPGHILIDPPTPDILARAAGIEGRTLSKSEFEQFLTAHTPEEQAKDEQTTILLALADLAEAQEADKTTMMLALVELAELYTGGV